MEILAQILIPVYITTWFRGLSLSLSLWQLSIYEVAGKKTKSSYINFVEHFAPMFKDAFSQWRIKYHKLVSNIGDY